MKSALPGEIFARLHKIYPNAKVALNFANPWQMLAATILSAQCTDKRVNIITEKLFSDYPKSKDYISMDRQLLIKYIRSAGFYNNKANNILKAAKAINEKYGGKVPSSMKELVTLPGVARKTANVVLANAFSKTEGIAVDTHVKRLSFRLGLTSRTDPDKIEKDLMDSFPRLQWTKLTYLLIEHGRNVCKAPRPLCDNCDLKDICPKKGV